MGRRLKLTVSIIPVLAILYLFFIKPIAYTLDKVQHDADGNFVGWSVFEDLLSQADFQEAFVYTLEIATVTTVLSVILAVATAMALRDTFVGRKIVVALYRTNISVPHITMATAVLLILGQTGLISTFAYNLGLIDNWYEFPLLVKGNSIFGSVLSFSLKFIPFIGLSVLSVLMTTSRWNEEQSLSLGVDKVKTFLHVTLPSLKPAIFSTSMIVFAYSFGSYEVPALLSNKPTVTAMAYNYYYSFADPNAIFYAYAISLIVATITISVAVAYLYTSTKGTGGAFH